MGTVGFKAIAEPGFFEAVVGCLRQILRRWCRLARICAGIHVQLEARLGWVWARRRGGDRAGTFARCGQKGRRTPPCGSSSLARCRTPNRPCGFGFLSRCGSRFARLEWPDRFGNTVAEETQTTLPLDSRYAQPWPASRSEPHANGAHTAKQRHPMPLWPPGQSRGPAPAAAGVRPTSANRPLHQYPRPFTNTRARYPIPSPYLQTPTWQPSPPPHAAPSGKFCGSHTPP